MSEEVGNMRNMNALTILVRQINKKEIKDYEMGMSGMWLCI